MKLFPWVLPLLLKQYAVCVFNTLAGLGFCRCGTDSLTAGACWALARNGLGLLLMSA
ncbi:hypothetical protein [Flavobacterium sp. CS20]|uniref:hypothetical protein n=1 Tax=Flavobacterium sp. CS20 TaxID=2775246 RepID=UPI001B3A2DF3|nr:hypothetical protein [Flavobacterium sp. CS20]QTY26814.1 hypothetical protein IGB25_13200 [Flavobacterium sp. CS20]QTY26819.1 hypothetical protein IGB25_13230 [Flavobacterium sp. CS20]